MSVRPIAFFDFQKNTEAPRASGSATTASFQKALQGAAGKALRPAEFASLARLQALRCAINFDDPAGADNESGFAPLVNGMLTDHLRASQKYSMMSESRPILDRIAGHSVKLTETDPREPLEKIIDRAAGQFGIAPKVIRAVIRAESNFDPQAVSPAGAEGLMQLMPGTAEEMGVKDSFDPEQNVMGGSRYLRRMLDRYDGDLGKALAAYNWGPGNLDRSTGQLPRETRTYLSRIRRYLSEGSA